jgi:hypothetical protein
LSRIAISKLKLWETIRIRVLARPIGHGVHSRLIRPRLVVAGRQVDAGPEGGVIIRVYEWRGLGLRLYTGPSGTITSTRDYLTHGSEILELRMLDQLVPLPPPPILPLPGIVVPPIDGWTCHDESAMEDAEAWSRIELIEESCDACSSSAFDFPEENPYSSLRPSSNALACSAANQDFAMNPSNFKHSSTRATDSACRFELDRALANERR